MHGHHGLYVLSGGKIGHVVTAHVHTRAVLVLVVHTLQVRRGVSARYTERLKTCEI